MSNAADHASRSLSAEELTKSNWFNGPAFLGENEILSDKEEIPGVQFGDPEVKANVRTATFKEYFSIIDCVSGFSSWSKSVAVVSYLKRPLKKNKPKTLT